MVERWDKLHRSHVSYVAAQPRASSIVCIANCIEYLVGRNFTVCVDRFVIKRKVNRVSLLSAAVAQRDRSVQHVKSSANIDLIIDLYVVVTLKCVELARSPLATAAR